MIKQFKVITLFPNFYNGLLSNLIYKKALKNNLFAISFTNLFDFAKKQHVDDYSYGGGEGMVLRVDCLKEGLDSAVAEIPLEKQKKTLKVLLSPKGVVFNHNLIKEWNNNYEAIILITGHYEDYDWRFTKYVDEVVSIGDFVLSNGEIAGLVVLDSLLRQIPGVINPKNLKTESFDNNLLDFDHYTRPYIYNDIKVADILVNGNHKLIQEWRYKNSLIKTYENRKDLLKSKKLSLTDKKILFDYFIKKEQENDKLKHDK
ncbi:tRNA (guanosine(37)-N1)-methyltransferase TrmD [Mycoplasma sp. SG1]|uniref:tRNA (guanosine(37)-N1)-methyltransferase TrmD n=1 Tax=Mycoplasma sp. SG1 TaxID=2810348 RepID=UPI00202562A9|nr:tRNA (guanosine(37)-N1)-methyltransferase TrmD [Mycoplasma sp. SG1]URM53043.1 tRNA (guanosine(37)-N1)-methyltransferase TrmD [Mycoplasma sp. SG1]